MKHKRFLILLMVAGLVALLAWSCGQVDYASPPDPSAYVRFLNAMIPEGSDTVSFYVLLDDQTVPWNGMRQIGSA
jgi:hypothetical protein